MRPLLMMPFFLRDTRRFLLPCLALLTLSVARAGAQPKAPKQFDAQIRYEILSPRDQHILHFKGMVKHLKSLGFNYIPGEDDEIDRSQNILSGKLTSPTDARQAARQLFDDPFVRSVLLTPPGFKVPADPEQPVRVQLSLSSGLSPRQQRDLFEQTLVKLGELKVYKDDDPKTPSAVFHEDVGYNHRNFSRIVGTIPAGQLETLLLDL